MLSNNMFKKQQIGAWGKVSVCQLFIHNEFNYSSDNLFHTCWFPREVKANRLSQVQLDTGGDDSCRSCKHWYLVTAAEVIYKRGRVAQIVVILQRQKSSQFKMAKLTIVCECVLFPGPEAAAQRWYSS